MTQALTITDLAFTYVGRSQPTINHVHLSLRAGEIVLIAGATGSGKSTLLNCLAGISPLHTGGHLSGEIRANGESLLTWTVQQRSRILGVVLQNVETQIFTDQVSEELAFGLENLNLPPTQIQLLTETALQEFSLLRQRHWPIARLSAGQKQRLMLACVLAMNQPVLLLDEPFAYLDRAGGEFLLRLLQQRAAQGQTVVLVEHRLDLVRSICDRQFYFAAGHLVEMGETPEMHHSAKPKVKMPNSSMPVILSAHVSSLPSSPSGSLLVTRNVRLGNYPAFPDLAVVPGEIVLLKGDNGCGKTTFLKLVCGLLKPTTGCIELLGRNIQKQRVVEIAKTVGFVLQNPNHQLFAESVRQEVMQSGVSAAIAAHLLAQLQLSDQAEQHPQSLSQGQKRRLALGAVLARQPRLCLLDEITVGQDPRSLALMLHVLQAFTQQGGTLILTSHDPQVADTLNARIIEFL